jgi:hypothetical protein
MRDSQLRVDPFVAERVAELHGLMPLLARATREPPQSPIVRAALRAGIQTALDDVESLAQYLKALARDLR